MKIDLIGQFILFLTAIVHYLLSDEESGLIAWILLFAWQMLSAFLLYIQFQYKQRKSILWIGLLTIPLAFWGSEYLLLFLIGFSLWYFYYTLFDTIKVFRRPRSFWELF